MFKIREARKLAEKIFFMEVEAPRVAKACQPGEFIIVNSNEVHSVFSPKPNLTKKVNGFR